MNKKSPSFLRALLIPWSAASVLFVAASSALLAFFERGGVFGVVGAFFLLSWLFKYAYVLLEHIANGRLDAPAVSVEMLGPFEQRPLLQILWCLVAYAASQAFDGAAGTAVTIILLALLPASIAVLGLGIGILQAFNPRTLWRVARGLGVYYLVILGLVAALSVLIAVLLMMDVWSILTIATAEMAILTLFSMIGGALFERRSQIGHEPIVSPERELEREDQDHARRRGAMLDEIYIQMRINQREAALRPLEQWLGQIEKHHLAEDSRTILQRAATWDNRHAYSMIAQTLIDHLIKAREPELALNMHDLATKRLEGLTLKPDTQQRIDMIRRMSA